MAQQHLAHLAHHVERLGHRHDDVALAQLHLGEQARHAGAPAPRTDHPVEIRVVARGDHQVVAPLGSEDVAL